MIGERSVGIVLVVGAASLVVACGGGSDNGCDVAFDGSRWAAAQRDLALLEPLENRTADEVRGPMRVATEEATRAVTCGLVVGRTKRELREVLGEPSSILRGGDTPSERRDARCRYSVGVSYVDGAFVTGLYIELRGARAVFASVGDDDNGPGLSVGDRLPR